MSEVTKKEENTAAAANEWDNVVCLPIIDISNHHHHTTQNPYSVGVGVSQENLLPILSSSSTSGDFDLEPSSANQFTTVQTLTEYIAKADITAQLPKINSQIEASGLRRLLYRLVPCLGRSQSLGRSLSADRDRLFALALTPFDAQNPLHCACLYTVYSKLTGNVVNGRRRLGPHWEEIGFQGSDPATDFRGVGLLGLLQLTFFSVTPEVGRLVRAVYALSLDGRQHFPFAVLGMNISQLGLQVLREGRLNGILRQRQTSVLNILNRFYFGAFAAFYKVWTGGEGGEEDGGKTILDMGYVLKGMLGLNYFDV